MHRWRRAWSRRRPEQDGRTEDAAAAARDERLSAYLDGALPGAEAAALDADLDADGSLRSDLEGMRGVRDALGALGEVRAPRPFTIAAPSPVPSRTFLRTPWLETATRLGAATAAVALLMVVAGDRLAGDVSTQRSQDSAASTVVTAGAFQTEMAAAAPVEESVEGLTADGTAADLADETPAGASAAAAAPAPALAPELSGGDTVAGEEPSLPPQPVPAARAPPLAATPAPETEKALGDNGAAAAGLPLGAVDEAETEVAESEAAETESGGPASAAVEIALLALAVALAAAALAQRAARRRSESADRPR